jgi:hypothetical protein
MPEPVRRPTLADVLSRAVANGLAEVRVGMPGRIESYDAATQTADVLPLPKPALFQDDGTEATEAFPVIPHVPVHFPGGGGHRQTFPVAAGDECWLSFADYSLDIWQARGGPYAPIDVREHHVSDAVCFPGLHSDRHAWADAPTNESTFGKDGGLTVRVGDTAIDIGGGATDFAALASKVTAALNAILAWATTHTHAVSGGTAAPTTTPLAIDSAVGSSTVKVKG